MALPIPARELNSYQRITRTATYGFLASLPLLLLYEVLIIVANGGVTGGVRVGAEVWTKELLASLGVHGMLLTGAVVLGLGIGVYVWERKRHIPIRAKYFGWMVGESAVYAVLLAFLISTVVGMIFAAAPVSAAAAPMPLQESLPLKLALSIGAGLYEELVFRVVLVGGLFVILRSILASRGTAYAVAAVVGALIFSWVHYIGVLGDAFELPSFTFRFLFGLALNGIFLARGFGVAAWTHALYDVLVVTSLLG